MSRSYRTPPAKWLHNEKPVDMITIDTRTELSGTGHRYIGDSSTAALHIDSARLEDDGIWRCIIEHEHGELLSGRTSSLAHDDERVKEKTNERHRRHDGIGREGKKKKGK
ncbi:hypothetical protein PV325_012728 [Microctonus aethiopoides]|nr:hypothetical protein PV325_012728 [Microctonus aethiopoides]